MSKPNRGFKNLILFKSCTLSFASWVDLELYNQWPQNIYPFQAPMKHLQDLTICWAINQISIDIGDWNRIKYIFRLQYN